MNKTQANKILYGIHPKTIRRRLIVEAFIKLYPSTTRNILKENGDLQ